MTIPDLEAMLLRWRGAASLYRATAAEARRDGEAMREASVRARAETLESCARELERWMEND